MAQEEEKRCKECEDLEILLDKYFKREFEFYRSSYDLVYGENKLCEDPESDSHLFSEILNVGHPYHDFMKKLEEDLMSHLKYVFILKTDKHRF